MEDLTNKRDQLLDKVSGDVVEDVCNYHDSWVEHLRSVNEKHGKDLNSIRKIQLGLQTTINSLIQTNNDMDIQLQTALSASKRLKNICIVRQKLNVIFNSKYKTLSSDTLDETIFKKYGINEKLQGNSGVRYAVYSIHTHSSDYQISNFYLSLNKIFHPKIHPDDIVKTAYNDLSEKDKREFGITNEIDTELRQLLFT
jgi:hypothetical protein